MLKRVFLFSCCLVSLMLVISCEIGLGSKPNFLPPEVIVDYPPKAAVIREDFVLRGSSKDDGYIKNIKAVFTDTEDSSNVRVFDIEVKPEWSVKIPKASLKDGKYSVAVIATDNTDMAVAAETLFEIDNTPPLFVVNRPSGIVKVGDPENDFDKYGAVFKVLGQAADTHNIDKIEVSIDGKNSFVRANPGFNIDVSFPYKNDGGADFLYTDEMLAFQAAGKLKATIILEDAARVYDGENDFSSTHGNRTSEFFLRSDVDSILEKCSLRRIHNMISFGGLDPDAKNALENLEEHKKGGNYRFIFSLDPRVSPAFSSSIITPVEYDQLDWANTVKYTTDSISIDLKPNKDSTPLMNATHKDIKVIFYSLKSGNDKEDFKDLEKCNRTIVYDYANPPPSSANFVSSKTGENYTLSIPLKATGVTSGWKRIVVEGKDSSNLPGHEFIAADSLGNFGSASTTYYYLFEVKSLQSAPRVSVDPLKNDAQFCKGQPSVSFRVASPVSNLKKAVWFREYTDSSVPNHEELKKDHVIFDSDNPEGQFSFALTQFSLFPEGENYISIKVSNETGDDSTSFRFVKDTVPPAIGMDESTLSQNFTGKSLLIGTFNDDTSGINKDSAVFKIGTANKNLSTLSGVTVEKTSYGWSIDFSNISEFATTAYGTKDSTDIWTVPISVSVGDKAKNTATKTFNIKIDPSGDKASARVSSPSHGETMGGTVQIVGSADIKNSNLGVKVASVEIQITGNSKNASESNDDWFARSWSSKDSVQWSGKTGSDWVVHLVDGTIGWNTKIEAENFINTGSKAEVSIRVRAKNSNGVYGSWSEPVSVTLDSAVPKIDEIKISGEEYRYGDYVSGDSKYITARLYDESGIQMIRLRGNCVPGGVLEWKTSGGQITGNNFETYFEVDNTHSAGSTGFKNYKIKDNALLIKSKTNSLKDVNLTITVQDGSQFHYTTSREVYLHCDNVSPKGDFGLPLWSGYAKFSGNTVTDIDHTSGYALHKNAKVGLLIFYGDKGYKITSVSTSGKTMTIDGSVTDEKGLCVLYKQDVNVFNVGASHYSVQGFFRDDDSGVDITSIAVKIAGQAMDTSSLSIIALQGNYYRFSGSLNSSLVTDGEQVLTFSMKDLQMNAFSKTVDVQVKNKPFKVKSVTYKTDVNLDGSVQNKPAIGLVEEVSSEKFVYDENDNEHHCNIRKLSDEKFTFVSKNYSSLTLSFEPSGTGPADNGYALSCDGTALLLGTDFTVSSDKSTLTFTEAGLGKMKNKNLLTIKVTQKDRSVPSNWYTQVTVPVQVAIADEANPTASILPLYWNNKDDNSLFNNSKDSGHVEIKAGEVTELSGKVIVSGSAWDDKQLKELEISAAGTTFTASYTASTGNWAITPSSSQGGKTLSVATKYQNTSGHYVDWTLEWDTEQGECSLSKNISIRAIDHENNKSEPDTPSPSSSTVFSEPPEAVVVQTVERPSDNSFKISKVLFVGQLVCFTKTDALTDTAYYARISKVQSVESGNYTYEVKRTRPLSTDSGIPRDCTTCKIYESKKKINTNIKFAVVPYITEVTVGESNNITGLSLRTLKGHYPCRTDKTLTVKGFNIKNDSDTVSRLCDTGAGTETSPEVNSSSILGTGVKSGYLVTWQNGISSKNNTNNNQKLYNKGQKTCINNMPSPSDDFYIDVWEVSPDASAIRPADGKLSEVTMRVSPINGMLGFSFNNGTALYSMPQSSPSIISTRAVEKNWDSYKHGTFVFGSNGNAYGVASGIDKNTNNNPPVASYFSYFSESVTDASNASQNYNSLAIEGRYHIEHTGVRVTGGGNSLIDSDRILSPSLAPINGEVCLAYYDSISRQIRFRAPEQMTRYYGHSSESYHPKRNNTGTVCEDEGKTCSRFSVFAGKDVTYANQGGGGVKVERTGHLPGDSLPRESGSYLCIATEGGSSKKVHIAWYDETNDKLHYAYTSDGTSLNPSWTRAPSELDSGGKYCQIVFDGTYVHVAYQGSDNHLRYVKILNGTPSNPVVIDNYNINGSGISIDVDETGKPVIGYYASWQRQARLAYKTGSSDDDWEITVVPSAHGVPEDRINACSKYCSKAMKDTLSVGGLSSGYGAPPFGYTAYYPNKHGKPCMGYAVTVGSSTQIEISQMR